MMKRAALVAAVLALLIVCAAQFPGDPPLRAELNVLGTKVKDGRTYYELEMVNPFAHPLIYYGFGEEHPVTCRDVLLAGTWGNADFLVCGVGIEAQSLPAHAKRRFLVFPSDDVANRVGVDLASPDRKPDGIVTLEWLPEKWKRTFVKWQYDRISRKRRQNLAWSERMEPIANPSFEDSASSPEAHEKPAVADPFAASK